MWWASLKLSDYAKKMGVDYRTAWNWYKSGKLNAIQMPTGTIITHLRQIKANIHIGRAPYVKKSVPNYLTPIDFKNSFFTI